MQSPRIMITNWIFIPMQLPLDSHCNCHSQLDHPPSINLHPTLIMSFLAFEPQSTSTPKKIDITYATPNLCSTPRSAHARYSLSKCVPLPIHASTPTMKKTPKSFTPSIHRLMYPCNVPTASAKEIWIL